MFLIIYLYGNTKFKKEIKSLLLKSDINENIVDIKSVEELKTTIKDSPKNIFLIDDGKIIYNKLLNKISFLRPKDSISKEFLDEHGIGDISFNSMNSFVYYILNRLNTCSDTTQTQEESLIEDDEIEEETRDLENIIYIDDIFDSEMNEAINEYEINNKNQTKENDG